LPSGGDCWFCVMRTNVDENDEHVPMQPDARGVTLGDASGDPADHLMQHIEDRYYVPSLAVNALREAGYKDVGVYLWLDMDPENGTMGKPDGRYDSVKRDIKKYMVKRMVPKAPTE